MVATELMRKFCQFSTSSTGHKLFSVSTSLHVTRFISAAHSEEPSCLHRGCREEANIRVETFDHITFARRETPTLQHYRLRRLSVVCPTWHGQASGLTATPGRPDRWHAI